jgi:hypothetical protein
MIRERCFYLIIWLCIFSFVSPPAHGLAQMGKIYSCGQLAKEPVLDGKVKGEEGWNGTVRAGNLSRTLSGGISSRETFFRIGYTKKALYIAVECIEPALGKIVAEAKDMGQLWGEDSVEIFILPRAKDTYHQLIVSAIGSRWNGANGDAGEKLLNWKAKTHVGKDFWSLEMMVPWEVLGTVPKEGDRWRMNVCRNIIATGVHEYAAWADMAKSFHDRENFEEILFTGRMSGEETAAPPQTAPGRQVGSQKPGTRAEGILLFSKPLEGTYILKGRKRRRISYRHGPYIAPRLSPDGESILLHSRRGGIMGIWLTDENGKQMQRICDGEQAQWSADGKKITFKRRGTTVQRDLASGQEENVTAETIPGPCPDGTMLAFQQGGHIYLKKLEDGIISQLTTAGGVQSSPLWSRDGKRIIYLQGPDPHGPWDIYSVDIANPLRVRRLDRNVHPAIDWNGLAMRGGSPRTVKGANTSVVYGPKKNSTFTIENDWLSLAYKGKTTGLAISPKPDTGAPQKTVTILADPVNELSAVFPLDAGREEVVFKLAGNGDKGPKTSVVCRLPRSRPYVEIKPVTGADEFFVKVNLGTIVIPDRFAHDLRISAAKYATSEVLLPSAPFVLGFSAAGESIFMLIAPSPKQHLTAVVDKGLFSGVKIASAGEPFFVAILPESGHWNEPIAQADTKAKAIKVEAPFPFAGQWRVSLFGEKNYSMMVDASRYSKLSSVKGLDVQVQSELVYIYGRNCDTPLDIITPYDVFCDVVGIERATELLNLEALTSYRTAQPPVPLHELQSPGAYSSYPNRYTNPQNPKTVAWRKFVQPRTRDFSIILELLGGSAYGGLNMADQPGIRDVMEHLCGDITNLLKGLDSRMAEYEEFLSTLEQPILDDVQREVEELRGKLANLPPHTEIAEVDKCITKIKGLIGSGGWIGQTKEFIEFAEVSLTALSQRQDRLEAYRRCVQRIRTSAGMIITQKPDLKDVAEKIRERTRSVLGNRYYLEGDWRGEKIAKGDAQ